jgi:ATP-dependent helicase/DNAse subunit B
LKHALKKDTEHRSVGAIPIDFEKGIEGDLCGLRFRGKIDRIDQIGDSGIHIIDYKSSTQNKSFKDLAKHPTGHGSKIQNLLYMALVLEASADNKRAKIDKLSSSYWFLAEPENQFFLTQHYGENEQETLFKTLNIIKSMLGEGLVPMTPKNQFPDGICGYCSFTQICPSNRMAIHERQKTCASGPFAQFLALSEKKTDAKSKSNQLDTEGN